MKKEYLNEENYKKVNKKIKIIIIIIFAIGISLGIFLLYKGISNESSESRSNIEAQLKEKKQQLEDKGIKYNPFATYNDGEEYDLKIITDVLNPSFNYCNFDEYKNNSITKEYCESNNMESDFVKTRNIMFGGAIIVFTCMICGFIYVGFVKRREIMAYSAQQVMPIAQEGIEKMAPSIGKVAGEITKNIKDNLKDDEK